MRPASTSPRRAPSRSALTSRWSKSIRKPGQTNFCKYVAVDDCGKILSPLLVEGQVHGGIAQGIAQALYEEVVYDENGQLVTATFMDYAVPKADMLPHYDLGSTVTPSPVNSLGVKGVGEAGTIGSTPCAYNAVLDALKPFGIRDLDDAAQAGKSLERDSQRAQRRTGRPTKCFQHHSTIIAPPP